MTDKVEDHSHQIHEHYVGQVLLIVEIRQAMMKKIGNIERTNVIENKSLDGQF